MLFHYVILKENNSTANSVLPNLMETFGTLHLVPLRGVKYRNNFMIYQGVIRFLHATEMTQ